MSKGELLYVKDMNLSENETDAVEEDIWDDTKLNDAYDKALNIAHAEVAKRLAMSTNTKPGTQVKTENDMAIKQKGSSQGVVAKTQKKKKQWKQGMHCRAIYEGDGQEYEAIVLSQISDTEYAVSFIGYASPEIVPVDSLKPSLGKVERVRQSQRALQEKADDGFVSQSGENMECSDNATSSERSFQKKKKTKKNKNQKMPFNLPELPMINPNMLGNLGTMDVPLPPPPPIGFSLNRSDAEDQALSSMLLSWYMSGYYTGLYQGMKRAYNN